MCKYVQDTERGFQVLTESVKTQIRDYRVEIIDRDLSSRLTPSGLIPFGIPPFGLIPSGLTYHSPSLLFTLYSILSFLKKLLSSQNTIPTDIVNNPAPCKTLLSSHRKERV